LAHAVYWPSDRKARMRALGHLQLITTALTLEKNKGKNDRQTNGRTDTRSLIYALSATNAANVVTEHRVLRCAFTLN